MVKIRFILILLFLLVFLVGGGLADTNQDINSVNSVTKKKWKRMANKKIYFAHQSVGFNIIDGIKDIMSETSLVNLHIVEMNKLGKLDQPGFYHGRVGNNGNPLSKIDDFSRQMNSGIGETADIAFFKFCFVDIDMDTPVREVFEHYKKTMNQLKRKFPETQFVHFTSPLSKTLTSWKTKVKVLIGKKDIWEYDYNIRKNEFNDLLRHYYDGKEPVFDIAYFESTYPDKERSTFIKNGEKYYDLVPEYTYDDGHLNEIGRKWVAEKLLVFLANMN